MSSLPIIGDIIGGGSTTVIQPAAAPPTPGDPDTEGKLKRQRQATAEAEQRRRAGFTTVRAGLLLAADKREQRLAAKQLGQTN